MVLLRLTQIQIMSKNKNERVTITLTDPDTGVTLKVPESKVTNWDGYDVSVKNDSYKWIVDSGIIDSSDLTSIYERPSDKTIRQRYTGHRKIDNISNIGIHTLEKMSKRGKK